MIGTFPSRVTAAAFGTGVAAFALIGACSSNVTSNDGTGGLATNDASTISDAQIRTSSDGGGDDTTLSDAASGDDDGSTGTMMTDDDAGDSGSGPDAASVYANATFKMIGAHTNVAHPLLYLNGYIYSPNYQSASVTVYDATTYAIVKTIAVGPGPDHFATDGSKLYVINRMAQNDGDAYLSVIDPTTNTVIKSIGVSTKDQGGDPDNYPTTGFPWGGCVANNEVYVTYPFNVVQGFMTVDMPDGHEHAFLPAGSDPIDVDIALNQMFITDLGDATNPTDDVIGVQSLTGTSIKQFPLPGPYHDVHAVGSRVFIARAISAATDPGADAGNDAGLYNGKIVVIDAASLTMTQVDVGSGPYGLASSGNLLYAMCQYSNRVDILDMTTLAVVDHIELSGFTPAVTNARGIAVSPAGDVFIESDGMISVVIPASAEH